MDAKTDPYADAAAVDGRERELKFEAEAGAAPKLAAILRALPGVAKRGVAARLVSTYFDVDGHALMKRGVSLRVRRRGRAYVQTIKLASTGVGLFDRPEWERRVRGPAPELSPEERLLLASLLGRSEEAELPLAAIFETSVKRTVYDVRRGALAVEAAIDEATLETGDHRSEFCELELELLSGEPASLFELAREIIATVPLRISVLSKSGRGYAALNGQHGRPVMAGTSPIRAGMTVEDAFLAVVADCVTQYRRNEAILLQGPNPKAVHQARVALRRLRSAFSLFKAAVMDPTGETLRAELKWLAGALGDVRDLDVFAQRRLKPVSEGGEDDAGAPEVVNRIAALRRDAYDAASAALKSPRAASLMIDLAEWAAIGGWRAAVATVEMRGAKIEDLAREVLAKRRRKLKKAGRDLKRLDPLTRHEARIEAKKLRYAGDFFEHVYPDAASRRKHAAFVGHLAELQARLGDLNDIVTARRITRDLAGAAVAEGAADAAFAAGAIAGQAVATAPKLLRRSAKSYAALVKAPPFWR